MEFDCPMCHAQLAVHGNRASCDRCTKDYVVEARCPDCHKPLEVLKACGAVDYFCQNGHGLISKKRVEWVAIE